MPVIPIRTLLLGVILLTASVVLLTAQPRIEADRSLAEATREIERMIGRGEHLPASERLREIIDSAAPGSDLSTPLYLQIEANDAVHRTYPALEAARRFLRLYPDDSRAGEVRYHRGILAYDGGHLHEARESFDEIIAREEERSPEAYYWIGRLYADDLHYDSAEIYIDRSLAAGDHSNTDDALYLSAWVKEGRGDYATAATLYRRLLDEQPNSPLQLDAQLRLGVNEARNGNYESALTLLSTLEPTSDRQREELTFYTAESNAALGRYDRSAEAYTTFLREFPFSPRSRLVRYGLGWSELQLGNYDQALASFRVLRPDRDSLAAAALYQIGAIQILQGDTNGSLATLHELIYRLPYESYSDNAYYQVGRIHYRRANYDSARYYFLSTARGFPESDVRVDAWHHLGESYFSLNDFDNAQYAFSRARKLGDPASPIVQRALYREGVMLYYVGRFNSGIDRLRRYVAEYRGGENHADATFWLAEALYQHGAFDEAGDYYQKVLKEYPGSRWKGEAMYGYAWALFQQKKFRESADAFSAYIAAFPKEDNAIEATIRLADAYRFLGQHEKAIATYESVGGSEASGARAEEARFRLAEAFLEIGETDRAIAIFRDLVRRYPQSALVDVYAFNVGSVYYDRGDREGDSLAVVELQQFAVDYPNSELLPRAIFTIGDAFYNLEQFDSAFTYYRLILDEHANSDIVPEAIDAVRFSLEGLGRGREAVGIIDEFMAKNPDRLPADSLTYMKAGILFDNGEFAESEAMYRRLVADYPESGLIAESWYQIARGYEYVGNVDSASLVYRKVADEFQIEEAAALALVGLADLELREGEYQGASQDFALFIERYGTSPRINEARYGSGSALLVLGDTAGAVARFRSVLDSSNVENNDDVFIDLSRIALAEILSRQGGVDEALDLLASVVARRLDFAAAEALLLRGRIMRDAGDVNGAIAELRRLTDEFIDFAEFVEPGMLELGALYEGLKSNDEAILVYEQLVELTQDDVIRGEAEKRLKRLKRG